MIRSSKHSLKFINKTKLNKIEKFIFRYQNMVEKYVNIIWNQKSSELPRR